MLRAYNEAAQKKDLAHFKRTLGEHQEALRVDAAAKAAKKSSKASKSKATAAPDTDTEMAEAGDDMDMDADEDVDEDVKSKGKKRKKTDVESDAEDKVGLARSEFHDKASAMADEHDVACKDTEAWFQCHSQIHTEAQTLESEDTHKRHEQSFKAVDHAGHQIYTEVLLQSLDHQEDDQKEGSGSRCRRRLCSTNSNGGIQTAHAGGASG